VHRRTLEFVWAGCLLAITVAAAGCGETPTTSGPVNIAPDAGKRHKEMSDFIKNQPKEAAKARPQTK
jgi:hypothetical protein